MSERKVSPTDYSLLKLVVGNTIDRVKQAGRKDWHQYLELAVVMDYLMDEDNHCYIVDHYLVVYELGSPWYASEATIFLNEKLVLRLIPGGDFRVVPAFLRRKAQEAGAVIAVVGTALAKSDAALASIYQRNGFAAAASTLTTEI